MKNQKLNSWICFVAIMGITVYLNYAGISQYFKTL